jgi:hypothetical protein
MKGRENRYRVGNSRYKRGGGVGGGDLSEKNFPHMVKGPYASNGGGKFPARITGQKGQSRKAVINQATLLETFLTLL